MVGADAKHKPITRTGSLSAGAPTLVVGSGGGYPHHSGLGSKELVHARHRITGHDTILETASIDVANGKDMLDRLRRLLVEDVTEEIT